MKKDREKDLERYSAVVGLYKCKQTETKIQAFRRTDR